MKTYTLLPILASSGSFVVGFHHGHYGNVVEQECLLTIITGSLVIGGSIVSYFHEHPHDAPSSWEGNFQSYARFGTFIGSAVSAGSYGCGYLFGRGYGFGLEKFL